jgi:hypothetical protein
VKRFEYPMAAAILAAALVLYLPTLRTGFLTDDFLDCSHTFDEAAGAFTGESSGGYRPLMTLAWALERAVWSAERPEAWHISSLFILAVFCFSLTVFIQGFVNRRSAVLAALALVLLCYPVAVSAARVSWRATMLAGVPFIWAMILAVRWCRRRSPLLLLFGALLFLVSLLFKETFLAAPPVFAALGNAASSRGKRLRNSALLFSASLVAVLVYGAMRYSAMGLQVNYQETTRFGLHTLSNLLLYGGSVFRPWLSMVPARVLLFTLTLPVFFLVREWKHRFLVLSLGLFPLLPVANLGVRPDLAVAAVPAAALFIAFLFQRLKGSRVLLALFAVFLLGVFQHSLDQVRILAAASRAVNETTDRLALIAEEVPGNSPLFIIGAPMSVGDYGTFWPGEFMIPLRCRGHEPGRQVAGTGMLWELLAERESGHMVFLDESDHRVYPVSSGMFTEQGDTLVHLLGGMDAGGLFEYPSCTA